MYKPRTFAKLALTAGIKSPAGPPAGGFTILEILIASAILVIGLVGVLALFPAGIASGRRVVEDSTAIAIARSVADAIRSGMRNNLRVRISGRTTLTYFIFNHDGIKDTIPRTPAEENPQQDYYILLPRFPDGFRTQGDNDLANRQSAVQVGKTFVYPESDPDSSSGAAPNGNGDPLRADNDGDDLKLAKDFTQILVRKVYPLGGTFPGPNDSGPEVFEDQRNEVLKQYSYAFAIRPSLYDANMAQYGQRLFEPANELYHVRVMVFRSFQFVEGNPPKPPIYELDFEVSR